MIEGLTPQLTQVSLFLVLIIAPVLTLLLAIILVWRYHRSVSRSMALPGGYRAPEKQAVATATGRPGPGPEVLDATGIETLYRRVLLAPWGNAVRYAVAGIAFAVVFALPAQSVFPTGLGVPGFLVGVWIYLWPVALALPLIVPGSLRLWVGCLLTYFLGLTLCGFWAATVINEPGFSIGGITMPARSTVTPETILELWLPVNGIPTFLVLLCFNRWVRAVAPLILALLTTAIAGTLVVVLSLFSTKGADAAVALSLNLNLHVFWLVILTWVVSLAVFGAIGWLLAGWISRAYRRRWLSDQSLMLDALWLMFAGTNCMWLVRGGLEWITLLPLGFVTFRLTLLAGNALFPHDKAPNHGLTFLRVFSLGQRSEALLQAAAKHWRHVGSIQLITGPDLVRSTVQPHQFLDFLSGRLAGHFVRDFASLQRRLSEQERDRDPDGRFRVNSFFCHQDSWQAALSQLVQGGDPVLMDLRSFSADNAGCIHELRFLVREVPVSRWLLIVDGDTDTDFLQRTLEEAWERLPEGSHNFGKPPEQASVYRFEPGGGRLYGLLQRLCALH